MVTKPGQRPVDLVHTSRPAEDSREIGSVLFCNTIISIRKKVPILPALDSVFSPADCHAVYFSSDLVSCSG